MSAYEKPYFSNCPSKISICSWNAAAYAALQMIAFFSADARLAQAGVAEAREMVAAEHVAELVLVPELLIPVGVEEKWSARAPDHHAFLK